MITTTITKTKEQISKKKAEITRLQIETDLLESRLAEQERLLHEFNEAKRVLEEKAQALIDSQNFDYDDVVEECKNVHLESNISRPVGVQFITNIDPATNKISYGEIFKESQSRMDALGEQIDSGKVSKQAAAKVLLDEIDRMIEVTATKKKKNEPNFRRAEIHKDSPPVQSAVPV